MVLWALGVWPRTGIAWLLVLALGPVLFLIREVAAEVAGEMIKRVRKLTPS